MLPKDKTPKIVAQDLIASKISEAVSYCSELLSSTGQWQEMTERERQLVQAQLKKVGDRCAKACGYDEIWYS